MALDILELGTIAVIGVVILIWGPEKVPEIVKTLGNARRDLESYTRQFQGITKDLSTAASTGNIDSLMGTLTGFSEKPGKTKAGDTKETEAAAASASAEDQAASGDRLLVEMAKKLQIPTQGKTRDEIQTEIIAKASQGPATPVEATQVQAPGEAAPPPTPDQATAPDPAGTSMTEEKT